VFCFDTDVLSAVLRRDPPLALVRRLAGLSPDEQFTTSITLGEMLYGATRRGSAELTQRVHELLGQAVTILSFDEAAAEVYGPLRARLEAGGTPLAEPDLRIASIALSRDLTVVSGNLRHFRRVPGLAVENWLDAG
jgi:tRNA(fMet)-specific endonuclease VapC